MSDYIDRQAALDALGERPLVWTEDDYYSLGERNQYDLDRLSIETIPPADLEEIMICGYPARHLAFIAAVMSKEGVSPKDVASCLRDIGRVVGMIMAEQKEIIEKTWKEWGSV